LQFLQLRRSRLLVRKDEDFAHQGIRFQLAGKFRCKLERMGPHGNWQAGPAQDSLVIVEAAEPVDMHDIWIDLGQCIFQRAPVDGNIRGVGRRRIDFGPCFDLDAEPLRISDLGLDVSLGQLRIVPKSIEHFEVPNYGSLVFAQDHMLGIGFALGIAKARPSAFVILGAHNRDGDGRAVAGITAYEIPIV